LACFCDNPNRTGPPPPGRGAPNDPLFLYSLEENGVCRRFLGYAAMPRDRRKARPGGNSFGALYPLVPANNTAVEAALFAGPGDYHVRDWKHSGRGAIRGGPRTPLNTPKFAGTTDFGGPGTRGISKRNGQPLSLIPVRGRLAPPNFSNRLVLASALGPKNTLCAEGRCAACQANNPDAFLRRPPLRHCHKPDSGFSRGKPVTKVFRR